MISPATKRKCSVLLWLTLFTAIVQGIPISGHITTLWGNVLTGDQFLNYACNSLTGVFAFWALLIATELMIARILMILMIASTINVFVCPFASGIYQYICASVLALLTYLYYK